MKVLPSFVAASASRTADSPSCFHSLAWYSDRVVCHWAKACERATVARTFRFWLGFDAASSMTFQYCGDRLLRRAQVLLLGRQ